MTVAAVFQRVQEFVADKNKRGLAGWLFDGMGEKKIVAPYTVDTYLTASKLHGLCPRLETLRTKYGLGRDESVSPELSWIFDVGKLYHTMYRCWYLGPRGVYMGKWRCIRCGWDTDGDGTADELGPGGVPIKSYCPPPSHPSKKPIRLVSMPEECPECGARRSAPDWTASGREVDGEHNLIVFDEWLMVNEELKIRAKSDGNRRSIVTGKIIGQELKSISAFGFSKVKSMGMGWKPEHKTQAMVTAWMAGLDAVEVVYMNKAGWKEPGEIVHPVLVKVDMEYLDAHVFTPVKMLRKHLAEGTVAPPLTECPSRKVTRVKECDYADQCFAERKLEANIK